VAQTISLTSVATGASAVILVDTSPTGQRIIRSFTLLSARSEGCTIDDLAMLDEVGLRDAFRPAQGTNGTRVKKAATREIVPTARKVPAQKTAAKITAAKPSASKTTATAKVSPQAPAAKVPQKVIGAGTRVYRRAPGDAVLMLDYERFDGNVALIAQEHGVPRPTASAWIGRLRRNNLVK
jgi:hypothetical protein